MTKQLRYGYLRENTTKFIITSELAMRQVHEHHVYWIRSKSEWIPDGTFHARPILCVNICNRLLHIMSVNRISVHRDALPL